MSRSAYLWQGRPRHGWRFYRNWLVRAFAWVAVLAPIYFLFDSPLHVLWGIPVYIFWMVTSRVFRVTHPRIGRLSRTGDPANISFPCQQLYFSSRDGIKLFAWYKPGPKRAAIILVHGVTGSGVHMAHHGAALSSRGYAVLMLDLRAHGRSEGDTASWGWAEINDVLGAVDLLQSREDVDPDRIGILGLSLGGQIAIRAAAQSGAIGAVVAEGPSEAALSDGGRPASLGGWLLYPIRWLTYAMQAFMSGVRPVPGIIEEIGKVSPHPLLLVAPAVGTARYWVRRCFSAASEPKELWEVPGVRHAQAYFADPAIYTARVTRFFDDAFGIVPVDVSSRDGSRRSS